MAKQGQHNNDGNDPDVSRGPNNPSKSQPITTGTYKKPETYKKQAIEHKDTAKQAQDHQPEWHQHTPRNLSKKDRVGDSGRSASDSDEDRHTRGY